MAANGLQNTPQTKVRWAAAGCGDRFAAWPCLGPAKRPYSESICQKLDSDQILTPVLPGDRDDQFKAGKYPKGKRETMVISEQLRRNRMKDLCSKLESLLPSTTFSKLDRRGLFEEACNYIRRLQNEAEELKKRREIYLQAPQCGCDDMSMAENYSNAVSNNKGVEVVAKVYEREAVITIIGPRKPRCHWKIVEEIEAHDLDLQMAQFSAGDFIVFFYFQGKVKTPNYNPLEIQTSVESRLKAIY